VVPTATQAAAPTTEPEAPPPVAGPPKSIDELIKRAVTALKENDAEGYIKLLVTREQMDEFCPKESKDISPKQIAKTLRRTREQFDRCHNGEFDWSQAKQVGSENRGKKRLVKKCGPEVYSLSDVRIYFEAGDKRVRFRIDDPVLLPDGVYAVADDPRCRIRGSRSHDDITVHPPPVPDVPVPDVPDIPDAPDAP